MSKPQWSEIRESLWRCGKKKRTIKRVVRQQLPIHQIIVGHFVAFHKYRYCMFVPDADIWFEIDYKDPLTQDYITKKEELGSASVRG